MILVDTSVWIDHLRKGEQQLVELLNEGEVCTHPFVIEELACGNLTKRSEFLDLISLLPTAVVAEHDEVIGLIADENLYGKGIGAVDAHLIASARLSFARLWSKDKAIRRETDRLGLSYLG